MLVKSPSSDHQSHERTRLLGAHSNGKVVYSEEVAYSHDAADERLADERAGIPADKGGLRRGLSSRQVQMIAIGELVPFVVFERYLNYCCSGYYWDRCLTRYI